MRTRKKYLYKFSLLRLLHREQEGFTLLESVVALFVVTLCVSLLSVSITQYQVIRKEVFQDRQQEWHLFLNQFEYSIQHLVLADTQKRVLTFEELDTAGNVKAKVFYERYSSVLRRTTGSGGYQPMLMKVQAVEFSREGNFLILKVTFLNGEKFAAHVDVSENLEES